MIFRENLCSYENQFPNTICQHGENLFLFNDNIVRIYSSEVNTLSIKAQLNLKFDVKKSKIVFSNFVLEVSPTRFAIVNYNITRNKIFVEVFNSKTYKTCFTNSYQLSFSFHEIEKMNDKYFYLHDNSKSIEVFKIDNCANTSVVRQYKLRIENNQDSIFTLKLSCSNSSFIFAYMLKEDFKLDVKIQNDKKSLEDIFKENPDETQNDYTNRIFWNLKTAKKLIQNFHQFSDFVVFNSDSEVFVSIDLKENIKNKIKLSTSEENNKVSFEMSDFFESIEIKKVIKIFFEQPFFLFIVCKKKLFRYDVLKKNVIELVELKNEIFNKNEHLMPTEFVNACQLSDRKFAILTLNEFLLINEDVIVDHFSYPPVFKKSMTF